MYTTISTKNMDRNEWLKIRKTGLGGSDAGAVCGLNPHVRYPMKPIWVTMRQCGRDVIWRSMWRSVLQRRPG